MCQALLLCPWVCCSFMALGVYTDYHSSRYYLLQLLGKKSTITGLLGKPTAMQDL